MQVDEQRTQVTHGATHPIDHSPHDRGVGGCSS
jgi:hypothetical protein